jgi:hypothetical protein
LDQFVDSDRLVIEKVRDLALLVDRWRWDLKSPKLVTRQMRNCGPVTQNFEPASARDPFQHVAKIPDFTVGCPTHAMKRVLNDARLRAFGKDC